MKIYIKMEKSMSKSRLETVMWVKINLVFSCCASIIHRVIEEPIIFIDTEQVD